MTLSALLAKLGSKRLDLFLTSLHALESEAGTVCEASPTKAMFDRASLFRLVAGRGLACACSVRMGSWVLEVFCEKDRGTSLRPQRVGITRLRTRESFVRVSWDTFTGISSSLFRRPVDEESAARYHGAGLTLPFPNQR